MSEFPESDWKVFREVRGAALERFCARVLREAQDIAADETASFHDRYLRAFQLFAERDRELSRAFNDPRRSQAMLQLVSMHALRLLTPEELARFSPATRETVAHLVKYPGRPRAQR